MANPTIDVKPRKPSRFVVVLGVVVSLAVLGLAVNLVRARGELLKKQTDDLATTAAKGPRVLVAALRPAPAHRTLEIPGSTVGFNQTSVFAKIPGYLKEIKVDKGDIVKEGEVLAVLQSPETDKQVANAKAAYWLAQMTDSRFQRLLKSGVVAQQDADNAHSAMLEARDNYQQVKSMQAYEVIRAPFEGIVTARYIDPGALIPQATSGPNPPSPLLTLATMRPLRVYTQVPQSVALFMRDGDAAIVTVSELPQQVFEGTITRHPRALDASSRTMLVEVDLPNENRVLYPGMYANVKFTIAVPNHAPLAPDVSLVFKNGKPYLPIIKEGHVHLSPVTLGRDDGIKVEIVSGANNGDLVAINMGQSAEDGEPVRPVMASEELQ